MLESNIEGDEVKEDIPIIPLPRISESNEAVHNYLQDIRKYDDVKKNLLIKEFGLSYCSVGFYAGRIIIPIKDSEGKQVSFEARSTNPEIKPKNIYPRGTQVGRLLFNHNSAKCCGSCCLVEGVWDVLRLHSYGIPNAIGLFGTNLSLKQAEMIIRNYQKVIVIMDGDDAGRKAQDKIKTVLSPYTEVIDVRLQYDDPDDLTYGDLKEIRRMYSI
jgi:DNA primase